MSELIQTENITESNLLDAVKRLNQAFLNDHKTIQTLQQELAERDEKLLRKIDGGFKATNQQLENLGEKVGNLETAQKETNNRLENMETAQKETNNRLENMETAQKEGNNRLENLETRMETVESSIKQMKNEVVQEQKITNKLLRELIEK